MPYAVTVTLKYEEIKKYPHRIKTIKTFINKYNWEGANCPSEKGDWKKWNKNNLTVALNALYTKKEKVYPGYVSKHNSNREKQLILLMISNGAKGREQSEALATQVKSKGLKPKSEGQQIRHYLAVKTLLTF